MLGDALEKTQCSVSAIRTAPSGASGAKPAVIRAREGNVPPVAPAATEEIVAVEHSFNVTVKYVRREVRSLTDFDREKFFNAVSVLQRVPSAVGQQVYGKKYYSKDFFNRLHLYYGRAPNTRTYAFSHLRLTCVFASRACTLQNKSQGQCYTAVCRRF